jgi:hypothetical protein
MRTLAFVCMLVLAAAPALAEDEPVASSPIGTRPRGGDLGLGASLGWPTGFNGKWWFQDSQGIAFGAGVGGFSWVSSYVDWQWTPLVLYQSSEISVTPYFGGGAFFGVFPTIYSPFLRSTAVILALGIEIPMGVSVNVGAYPLDVFAEIAPGLSVLPHIGVGTRAMVGARWYIDFDDLQEEKAPLEMR